MMSDLLQYLENNEAILLMYLAGELPEQDRVEVEQLLSRDAGLRASLAELAALQDDVTTVFARTDADLILSGREAAVRNVSKAIAADAERRASGVHASAPARQAFRVPWWTYPIAAAAIVLVAVIMTTPDRPHNMPADSGHNTEVVISNETPEPSIDTVAIIPEPTPDDSLGQLEKAALSINVPTSELDLFGGFEPEK
jgi:hypothetical protein